MLARFAVAGFALVVMAVSLEAQAGARRPRPTAFPLAVTASFGLGFNGTRADETDAVECPSRPCIQHTVGSSPTITVDLQVPLVSTLGLSASVAGSRPSRVQCNRGICVSGQRMNVVRGTGLLLVRLKARAPIYLGLGASAIRYARGPVSGQEEPEIEIGGAVRIGYDFLVGDRVGGRVTWSSYIMRPSDNSIPASATVKSIAYDNVLAVGARIRI